MGDGYGENHHQARVSEFRRKVLRRVGGVVLLLFLVLCYGTLGFVFIEGAEPFDAFYMTVITTTTVGFGETIPLSLPGRIFAVSTIFLGVLSSGVSLGMVTNLLFEETILNVFRGRKMQKLLSTFTDHYIVCGCGATGQEIVDELAAHQSKVVIIDQREKDREWPENVVFLQGDARKDEVLRGARIECAKGLASCLTEDADNVFVVLTARSLNPELKIVSRYKAEDTDRKLVMAGVDHSVSPYRMGGHRLALALTDPMFLKVLDSTFRKGSSGLKVRFAHVEVPAGSPILGKTVANARIREESMGGLLVALVDKKGEMIFNPSPEFCIREISQILLLGDQDQVASLESYVHS